MLEEAISAHKAEGHDPVEAVAERIAGYRSRHRSGTGNTDTVLRTLWRIRNGRDSYRGKSTAVTGMRFETADEILCALDRVHLWREDERLADAYRRVKLDDRRRRFKNCPGCGGKISKAAALCGPCEYARRGAERVGRAT